MAGHPFLESPGLAAWGIFWLYFLLLCLGGYSLSRTFKQKGIVIGHLDDLFRFLTDLRVWSIRFRKTYTVIVTGILGLIFLITVYGAEKLHTMLYGTEPAFSNALDYLLWIGVFVISGLQQGAYPNSFIGLVLSGVFPVAVLGSVLSIVRFTSESAHERLIKQMAEGNIGSYRIVVFNYREMYDEFIESLLEQSDAFVVIFAKEQNLHDAESFVQGLEETDTKDYRTKIEELSYSEDLLFEQYGVLDSEELFIFPDTDSETDYANLRLITQLNQRVRDIENDPNRAADPPSTVWLSDSRKLTGVSHSLEPTSFREHLHAVNFQHDVRDLIRLNIGDPLQELEQFFNLTDATTSPSWFQGYGLDNYTFQAAPLADSELAKLEDIRQFREKRFDRTDSVTQSELAVRKQEALETIHGRLNDELRNRPPSEIGVLYGLLTKVSGSRVPIEFSSAYLNQQMETATDTIQLTKTADVGGSEPSTDTSSGDIFIINYNARVEEFILSFGDHESEEDRHLTVYTSSNQVTPDVEGDINSVEYRSTQHLLEMLFFETEDSPRRVKPGDNVMLFLDHTIDDPGVNLLRILDAIDSRLDRNITELDHNDVFLAVEADSESSNEEYRYLAVDKVLETHQTNQLFLHNLVQFRTTQHVKELVQEGKWDHRDAVDWAVNSAYYLREFRVDTPGSLEELDTTVDTVTGTELRDIVVEQREYGRHDIVPFTTLTIERTPNEDEPLGISLAEPSRDHQLTSDEYLLSFPRI